MVMGWLWLLVGCSDFIEVDAPVSELDASLVFASDESALSATTGIYTSIMYNFGHFANKNTTLVAGLSADEFTYLGSITDRMTLNENNMLAGNSDVAGQWEDMYQLVYQTNAVMEGLEGSDVISEDLKQQLLGEVYFMRAFTYFYLVNFFGAVPYITTTDYAQNSTVSRSPVATVYAGIVSDLQAAMERLSEDYDLSGGARIRPNLYAAKALLARVYLYQEDWEGAFTMASEVLAVPEIYTLESLDQVYVPNNTEVIWQLYPVYPGLNTLEGYDFTCCVTSNINLTQELLTAFEAGDNRYTEWVASTTQNDETYYYPYRYKVTYGADVQEYYTVLRLAEVYLIHAEAAAHLNQLDTALSDVNTIRTRAGLGVVSSNSMEQVLERIAQERRIELFAEWGHRWFDLKRTGTTAVLSYKPDWNDTDVWYPIPESERLKNPNLTQNDGY